MKRPLSIMVTFAKEDGICQTLEGQVSYCKGDAILMGIYGEKWPISRVSFDDRYMPLGGIVSGCEGTYIKKPLEALALKLEAALNITLSGGNILEGKPGDWLLQYAEGELGIVKDSIFLATYDFVD